MHCTVSEWPSNNQVDALWKRVQRLDSQAEMHPIEIRRQYDDLLKEVRQCNDRELLIRTLHLFGKATYFALDYEATLRYNSEVLDIALLDNKIEWAFRAQNALGLTRMNQQLHREALEELLAASRLAKQLNDTLGYAKVLTNMALCHFRLQDLDKAYSIQMEALEILRGKEFKGEAAKSNDFMSILCLGQLNFMTIQNERIQPQSVLEIAPSTLSLAEEINALEWEVFTRCEYSYALRTEGQITKAYNILKNMQDYSEDAKKPEHRAAIQMEMAYIMRDLGDLSKMHEYLEKLLSYSQDMGLIEIESRVHAIYAQYFEQKGNYKLALKHNRLQSELEQRTAKNIFDAHARSLVNYAQLRSLQRDLALERRKNQQLAQQNDEFIDLKEKLTHKVKFDKLTGLKDRKHFMQSVQTTLADLPPQEYAAFLLIKVDCPNIISKSQEYTLRDQILQEVAKRLSDFIRQPNLIGRMGSSEFGVFIKRVESRASAESIARELLEVIEAPYIFVDRQINIRVTIGCTIAPDDGNRADLLETHADMILSENRQCTTQVRMYHPQIKIAYERHLFMQEQLQGALQRGEFELYYQGRFEVKQSISTLVGLEALLRWKHPQLGEVLPDTFLPLAEQGGLLESIGQWVVQQVCEQAKSWSLESKNLYISVNFAEMQLQPQFVVQLEELLQKYQLDASALVIELGTSFTNEILNQQDLLKSLGSLQALGCQVVLDDFGSKYIHLMSLHKWPLNYISLDKDFIKSISLQQTQASQELLKGLMNMADCLNIRIIAKGIEQETQIQYLQMLGLSLFQGFYLHAPVPVKDINKILE